MPKICEFNNCRNRAIYGTPEKKIMFCLKHKTEEMKNFSRLCFCGRVQPSFNIEGKPAKYCSNCKTDGMIDVFSKKCFCKKVQPSYNIEGNPPKFCFDCKTESMVNVVSKRCVCGKGRARYNKDGEAPNYCNLCKTNDMLNVADKKCFCNKARPTFNKEGEPPKYCIQCKKDDMVNVKSNKCPCGKPQPCYNIEGEPPKYCSNCKTPNMINVISKKCYCGKSYPSFNNQGEPAKYCSQCKTESMIDVAKKKCKNNGCYTKANRNYKNYCANCFQHLFPLDPITFQIRCKTKEIAIRDFINSNFQGFQHDRILEYGGCDCLHRRRIDHRKLIGNTLLCIETDENQHKTYSKEDETARYNDLMSAFTCKYIIVRFNPDSYLDEKKLKRNPQIGSRLEVLKEEIDKQIKRIEKEENNDLLEIIYLFYDLCK